MTLIHDPAVCRLGKGAAKAPRLMLRDYVASSSVFDQAPQRVVNSTTATGQVALAMYLNDRQGDCTCAAIGNILRVNSRGAKQLLDAMIEKAYVDVTRKEGAAFDPATGANDNGCIPLDVLDYWTTVGVGGDKLLGHAGVDMSNPAEVRWVLWKTGSLYQGIQLAVEQQSQQLWDYVDGSKPGSWGGHLFPLFDRIVVGGAWVWQGGTWGAYKCETDAFMAKQADEGHALITDAFLAANHATVDVEKLKADLALLKPER